jgi:hypothetical protein
LSIFNAFKILRLLYCNTHYGFEITLIGLVVTLVALTPLAALHRFLRSRGR